MVAYQNALSELTTCLDTNTLLDLARRFSETYRALAKNSTEHFLTTPVTVLPTGKERGKFLAIDVGGSNLRVGVVELLGEGETVGHGDHQVEDDLSTRIKRNHDKSWPIGDHLKMDQPEDLFRWIGDCMAEVIQEAIDSASLPKDQEVQLGVTFSFPMVQNSLSEATLLPMGKGFAITSNLNLGEMLLAGYSRHCTPPTQEEQPDQSPASALLPRINVAAITNDTVATLISLAYVFKPSPTSRVAMGLIVGTGTNATVPMDPGCLHPAKQAQLQRLAAHGTVVINTEWTIRGTDAPLEALGLKTKWDRELDATSDAPGFQPFEYMTSGRYLGEIVRLVFLDTLEDVINDDEEEGRNIPASLTRRNALPTHFLSETVLRSDESNLPTLLQQAYPSPSPSPSPTSTHPFWTPARATTLRHLATAVQRRSSALIAAACAGLLDSVGAIHLRRRDDAAIITQQAETEAKEEEEDLQDKAPQQLIIAYTGGTISRYPLWKADCQRWLDAVIVGASASASASAMASGLNSDSDSNSNNNSNSNSNSRARVRVVLREAVDGGVVGAGVLAGMGMGTGRE